MSASTQDGSIINTNPVFDERDFEAENARPFLVTRTARGERDDLIEVHVSSSLAPRAYASTLRRQFQDKGSNVSLRVHRHGQRHLWRSPSLASFVAPLKDGDIVLDPTGAIGRARGLTNFADAIRVELSGRVDGVYWEPQARELFVVFNRKSHVAERQVKIDDLVGLEKLVRRLLLEHAGAKATDYIQGVKLGFDIPPRAFVPVDSISRRHRRSSDSLRKLGRNSALAVLLGAAVPTAAAAQGAGTSGPAVSAPNWELGIAGGARDGDGAFLGQGSYIAPLDYSTGFRIDGAAGSTGEGFQGGVAGHLFTRDPGTGLLGGFFSWGTSDPDDNFDRQEDVFELGAEADLYYGNTTLGAIGGYQFSDDVEEGFFGELRLEWYATDDLLLSAGGSYDPERDWLFTYGAEYQPGYAAMPGLAFYADGATGDDYDYIYGGVRFYFGAPKSLKDRHRFDTFRAQGQGNAAAKAAQKAAGDDFVDDGGGGNGYGDDDDDDDS